MPDFEADYPRKIINFRFFFTYQKLEEFIQINNKSFKISPHPPIWSGGVPVIVGEMCRVLTFPMDPQCGMNAVVLILSQK